MTAERDDDALLDMLIAARKAIHLSEGWSWQQFTDDEVYQQAITRLVQIVGEAARRVSSERRAQIPEVPWVKVVGMRHRVVHDYTNVNIRVVRRVLRRDLPDLVRTIEPIVPPDEGDA
jgi:uncharacterized protein with HEPN domain